PNRGGKSISQISSASGTKHFVRLVTYVPGTTLAEVRVQSPELLRDLGRMIAQLDRALISFDHPAIHRDFHWDLVNGLIVINQHAPLIADREFRALVEKFAAGCSSNIAPILPRLRRSAIHNDANDHNVVCASSSAGGPPTERV